jgi:hypothetical protein
MKPSNKNEFIFRERVRAKLQRASARIGPLLVLRVGGRQPATESRSLTKKYGRRVKPAVSAARGELAVWVEFPAAGRYPVDASK